MTPGSTILLAHGREFVHRFVQVGQRVRMALAQVDTKAERKDWCAWDHVALYVGAIPGHREACLVEALPGPEGVRVTPLAAYDARDYLAADVTYGPDGRAMNDHDRAQAIEYALACVGIRYGLAHFLGMTITTLTGGAVTFSGAQAEICSSMVAQALCRGPHIFDRPPACTMPADLARYAGARRSTAPHTLPPTA